MSKNVKIILIVVAVAVAGYLGWKFLTRQQDRQGNPPVSGGTNLNSTAPELVGGSTGPEVGRAASIPVNITLNETVARPEKNDENSEMKESNNITPAAIMRQTAAASDQSPGIVEAQDNTPGPTTPEPGSYEMMR